MTAVEKIKTEASKLNPTERYELFRWLAESKGFKQLQLVALKKDIVTGIEDLEHGRYRVYSNTDIMLLAKEIGQTGRKRLAKAIKVAQKP